MRLNLSEAGIKLKHLLNLSLLVSVHSLHSAHLPVVMSHSTEEWSHTLLVALVHSSPLVQQQPADCQPATSCCCCQS